MTVLVNDFHHQTGNTIASQPILPKKKEGKI